jgi:predicted phage-related endonuclease
VELWKEKTGQLEASDDFIEKAFWGTHLEEPILRGIPEVMQMKGFIPEEHKIRKDGKTYWHSDKINGEKYIYGHLDGRVGTDIAEIKHQGGMAEKSWKEHNVPPWFYWQGICALLLCPNADVWRIYSLCNGQIIYRIIERPDVENDIEFLLDSAHEFWSKNVLGNIPPEAKNERDLRLIHPEESLKSVVITQNIKEKLDKAKALQAMSDLYREQAKDIKLSAKIDLGDADEIVDENGSVLYTYSYVKPRKTVDNNKLKTEFPEIYELCIKVGEPSRSNTNESCSPRFIEISNERRCSLWEDSRYW